MRLTSHARRLPLLLATTAATLSASGGIAAADTVGPINFESPNYAAGNINAQRGWLKTGAFDVNVASVSGFTNAKRFGFGKQALQVSDAATSGSFGDQAFSPGLRQPAGASVPYFDASFMIGTTKADEQLGLHMSVSPDDGNGSRMSYLRFEDQADGVHVFFDDVTNAGVAESTFNETDIATIDRAHAHLIRFSIHLKPGTAPDKVKIFIDGRLRATGTTWESYYRYDAEQASNGNKVPTIGKLLIRESATANTANTGQGFLIDRMSLSSARW
jgi:hypothetical protein